MAKFKDITEPLRTEARSRHQRSVELEQRRQLLLQVARRSDSAVTFVELVDELGLENELEELLRDRVDWQIAVTNARAASQLTGVFAEPRDPDDWDGVED